MRYFFASLDENHKLLGKFGKFSKIFDKNSIEKLNFSRFLEKFCRFIQKEIMSILLWWMSLSLSTAGNELTCFYNRTAELLLKIEPSQITSFFYNNFSCLGGGENSSPRFPLASPLMWIIDFPFLQYCLGIFPERKCSEAQRWSVGAAT